MSGILVIVVLVLVLAVIVVSKAKSGSGSIVGFPYQRAPDLFSAAERSFFGVLDQAVAPEYRVFGKVRIADLAALKPGLSASARQGALNRVASKHFDFVVCRASDFSVLCVVELNDKTHGSKRGQARDEFVINVCRAIGLPLLQVPAQRAYAITDIRAQLQATIGVTKAVA
jgi:hypothetical protein